MLLALEVVWFRFLALYIVGHTLALALMLATVLAGIGLGGVAAPLARLLDVDDGDLRPRSHRPDALEPDRG